MKRNVIKFIGIFLLGIIVLVKLNTSVYASMDAEQIKTLFDMYENNLGDINDLKKVIDQMYSDVNGATKVDDQLKAKLKKDVQDLNTISGIDANVVTLLSTQLNTEIDNLTDDNLTSMKEEVTNIKQWVDNKVASSSSSSTNTNTSPSTNTGTTTGTTNNSGATTNTTNTTTNTSTVNNNNSSKQTTTTNISDKTSVKNEIPHAGSTNTAFVIFAISVVVMIILAIKCKNLKEIK